MLSSGECPFRDIAALQLGYPLACTRIAQGVSRSASVVLAFLVRHREMSLADAWAHVYARRDVVPNIGFWSQLLSFEQAHRGCLSVVPAQLRGHDTWAFVFDSESDAAAYFRARGLPEP